MFVREGSGRVTVRSETAAGSPESGQVFAASQPAAGNRRCDAGQPLSIRVAFWNLQNLFDTALSPMAAELEYAPIYGWDRPMCDSRIRCLAQVISRMFDGSGPDLLGLCEIENEHVARRLMAQIGRSDLELAHVVQPGFQALDTALIYSRDLFEFDATRSRGHLVHSRFPTRDIFEVHLRLKSCATELVVLVNHWPSRKAGRSESEPQRLTVAGHLHGLVNSLVRVSRKEFLELKSNAVSLFRLNQMWNRNILIMGDFNDEPWSPSVLDVLGAGYSVDRLRAEIQFLRESLPSWRLYSSHTAWLFNPMWALLTVPDQGTWYDPQPPRTMVLRDQIMLSRGLYLGLQGLQIVERVPGIPDVRIFRPDMMTTPDGRPRPFQLENRTGYSDHFPITAALQVCDARHPADRAAPSSCFRDALPGPGSVVPREPSGEPSSCPAAPTPSQ